VYPKSYARRGRAQDPAIFFQRRRKGAGAPVFTFLPFLGESMKDMTDDEYGALDECLIKTVPTLGPNEEGFFQGKGFKLFLWTGRPQEY
jgi:hypothetical protein